MMRFTDQVVEFDFCNIPLIGNLANGKIIGLTDAGKEVCHRAFLQDVSADELAAVDERLPASLKEGGFFGCGLEKQGLQAAYFHITQRCNFDCVGCYSYNDLRNKQEDPPLINLQYALSELARNGAKSLIVSGGEPFLREDLKDILRFAKKECSIESISVLSNGYLITDEALEAITPWVDVVSVSFDGHSKECIPYVRRKQYFDTLVESIERIKGAGIRGHIIPTIHAKNYHDMEAYMELADRLGVTINFSLLIGASDNADLGDLAPSDEDLEIMGREILSRGSKYGSIVRDAPVSTNLSVKRNCGAGVSMISVAADGKVYPCHMMHESGLEMGNVFEVPLKQILEGPVANSCANLCVEEFSGCNGCEYIYLCGGGCRARSLFSDGNLYSKDSMCHMTREFYARYGEELKSALGEKERR